MLLSARLAALAALAGLAACSDPAPAPACDFTPPPGGETDAPEAALVFATADGELRDLGDGGAVPLIGAPQGGHILLIGARVRGVTGCSVNLTVALRDTCNDRVIGLEQRPITIRDRGDGWAVPVDVGGLANFANVAVCPVEAATHDVDGTAYQLEARITDDAGRVIAELEAMITPTCDVNDGYCQCECDIDPGDDCFVDPVDADPGCPAVDANGDAASGADASLR